MNLNWSLLRTQKQTLLNLCRNPTLSFNELNSIDGIINLIDHIQDYAVDQGNATEDEVFGLEREN